MRPPTLRLLLLHVLHPLVVTLPPRSYWPTDLYDVNPSFGTPGDLQHVLQQLADQGMKHILDVVMNHVGYGSSVFLPAFNPFSDPSNFHNCTLAGGRGPPRQGTGWGRAG